MSCAIAIVAGFLSAATSLAASDLVIATSPTSNVTFANGVFTATGPNAVLNVATLTNALATSPVIVRTGSAGTANGDITIANAIAISSTNSLRIEAYRNIIFNASLVSSFGADIDLRADATGTGTGTVTFAPTANVVTSGGQVNIFYNPATFGTQDIIYLGGTTPTRYMLVNTLAELESLSQPPLLSANFALGRDIDASATALLNSGRGFTPIGTQSVPFTGRFRGEHHVIRALYINQPGSGNIGFFGYLQNASIADVGIIGANVTGAFSTGALAGFATASTITDAFSNGAVADTSGAGAGGLIGDLYFSTLSQSFSRASVSGGTGNNGGLVAFVYGSTIANSYALGSVAGPLSNGGLAGGLDLNSSIVNCFSSGAVSGSSSGGLVGFNNEFTGTVSGSYWDVQSSGQSASADGAGKTTAEMRSQSTYAAWDFTNVWTMYEGKSYPSLRSEGEFAGDADLTISNDATSNVAFSNGIYQAGAGFANLNAADLDNALTSGAVVVRSAGSGIGDVGIVSDVVSSAGNLLRIEARGDIRVGGGIASTGAVQLRADSQGSGIGRVSGRGQIAANSVDIFYNPASYTAPADYSGNAAGGTLTAWMLVNDVHDLQNISSNLAGTYALGRDIDASETSVWNSGAGFAPIGTTTSPFTGHFSGDFHAIRGLLINRPTEDSVALFGDVSNATIANITLDSASVSGANQVGALIGSADSIAVGTASTVTRCRSTGSVVASGSEGGGLIGTFWTGTVAQSSSSATVTATGSGQQYFGGLIGLANAFTPRSALITDSYATGAVNAGSNTTAGGLIGFNNNTTSVENCYSTGEVTGQFAGGLIGFNNAAPVVNSYWDVNTSGQSSSGGGTGLTTSQMQQQATFFAWDFTETWGMFSGVTAPFHQYQTTIVASAPSSANAGSNVTYSFSHWVSNRLTVPRVAARFTHTLPTGFSFVSLSSPPGWTCTTVNNAIDCSVVEFPGSFGTFTIQASIGPGVIGAVALAGHFDIAAASYDTSASTTIQASTDLQIVKTHETTFKMAQSIGRSAMGTTAGGPVQYTLIVNNAGPADARNVLISDPLPAGVTFSSVSAPSDWACLAPVAGSGGTVTCSTRSFAAGTGTLIFVNVNLPASLANGATVVNTATIASDTNELNPADNTSTDTLTVSMQSDVGITVSGQNAIAGTTASLIVTASNNGPSDASAAAVSVVLSVPFAGMDVPSGWTCTAPPAGVLGTISCSRADFAPGTSQFAVRVSIPPDFPSPALSVPASITSSTPDPDPTNNQRTASIVVTASADLLVGRSIPTSVVAGTSFADTIVITNNGPSSATNVVVSEIVPGGTQLDSISNPPDWSCLTPPGGPAAVVNCTAATLDPGSTSVTLGLSVDPARMMPLQLSTSSSASTLDPVSSNNNAIASITVTQSADMSVTASGAASSPRGPLTWTINVANSGPSQAAGVTMSATIVSGTGFGSITAPAGWSCATPAIGASGAVTCSNAAMPRGSAASFSLTTTVNSGPPLTTASLAANVASTTSDPVASNNAASVSVALNGPSDLAISQVVPGTAIAGLTIDDSITVTNPGPTSSSDLNVSLTLPSSARFSSINAPTSWHCSTPPAGASGAIVCTTKTLAVSTATFDIVATIDAATPATTIPLVATLTTSSADPNVANNSSSVNVAVSTLTDVSVTMTGAPNPVQPGSALTHFVTVVNSGPSFAAGGVLTISLPPSLPFASMTPAAGWSCSPPGSAGSVVCTIASMPVGTHSFVLDTTVSNTPPATITTTATVATTSVDSNASNNSAQSLTAVSATPPAMTVTKSVGASSGFRERAPVTYSITITNGGTTGQSDNPGDEMVDAIPPGVTVHSVSATGGIAAFDATTNRVTWNGAIAPGATVTVSIRGSIDSGTTGSTISNRALLNYDADGNGTNESTAISNTVSFTVK